MGAIRLGCIWTDQSGEALDGMTSVAPVLRDTPPGESVPFKCRVKAPPEPGQFFLIWDLHEKGVGWFRAKGAQPLRIPIEVR